MPESTPLITGRLKCRPTSAGQEKRCDAGAARTQILAFQVPSRRREPTRRTALGLILGAPLLGACAGMGSISNPFSSGPDAGPAGPPQQPQAVGTGGVKVGLVLPLSASGNAGVAAQSMKNAAEMALAEFQNPNIQLLIKDDAGTPQGASQGTQQALDEGAEIILGPLFAASVPSTAALTRTRGVSVIAFSTDSSVAGRGVYLLSFLPESDVNRIVEYAASTGKRSFAALLPDNAYGNVVEAAFKQAVGRRNGRIVAFEKYGADRADAGAHRGAGAGFGRCAVHRRRRRLRGAGRRRADRGRRQSEKHPAARHRSVGQSAGVREPGAAGRPVCRAGSVRLPQLSPAATAPSSAPIRCAPRHWPMTRWRWSPHWRARKATQRFSPEVLTNPSGFAGIDGLFRFRADGTNERGLAVMKVGSGGGAIGRGFAEEFWRVTFTPRDPPPRHRAPEIRPASRAAGRWRRR